METETQNTNLTPEQNEALALAKNEIEEILQKHGVVLVPVVVHFGDKTFSRIDIAPAPSTPQS